MIPARRNLAMSPPENSAARLSRAISPPDIIAARRNRAISPDEKSPARRNLAMSLLKASAPPLLNLAICSPILASAPRLPKPFISKNIHRLYQNDAYQDNCNTIQFGNAW